MKCKTCNVKMKVYVSKSFGTIRKRVYMCQKCGHTVTTTEILDENLKKSSQ